MDNESLQGCQFHSWQHRRRRVPDETRPIGALVGGGPHKHSIPLGNLGNDLQKMLVCRCHCRREGQCRGHGNQTKVNAATIAHEMERKVSRFVGDFISTAAVLGICATKILILHTLKITSRCTLPWPWLARARAHSCDWLQLSIIHLFFSQPPSRRRYQDDIARIHGAWLDAVESRPYYAMTPNNNNHCSPSHIQTMSQLTRKQLILQSVSLPFQVARINLTYIVIGSCRERVGDLKTPSSSLIAWVNY